MPWAIANGLEISPKGCPGMIEMMNKLILGQMASPSLRQDTTEVVIVQGTWRTLHSKQILHAPNTISEHAGFWSVISLEIERGVTVTIDNYLKVCVMHLSPLLTLKLRTCPHFVFRKIGRLSYSSFAL